MKKKELTKCKMCSCVADTNEREKTVNTRAWVDKHTMLCNECSKL